MIMKLYRHIGKLNVQSMDTDDIKAVPENSVWFFPEEPLMQCHTEYEIYLENCFGDWLGLAKETFEKNFVEIEGETK